MKLAILTQYYPPETGAPQNRLSDFAERMAARGHDVQVLTALPNYPGDAVLSAYSDRANSTESVNGVRVARVGLYVPSRKTFARRLAMYVSFAANARRHGPWLLNPADVLMMESPPLFVALAGVALAKRLGARLVTNISDLWPRSAVELGLIGPGIALRCAEKLEAWMYKHSAAITAQTEGIAEDISRRFPKKRIALFPNGVDLAEYEAGTDRGRVRQEFQWASDHCVAAYTGVLGHAQALDQVLDAARLLESADRVCVAIFGDGPCRAHLVRRVADEQIAAVRIYPHQPRARISEIHAASDVGLVPLAKGRVFEGARPSKMFEVMAAGKPVLLCGRGEAARLIGAETEHAGIAVPPEEPHALADALRRLARDPAWAASLGARGRALARMSFDRDRIATDLEQMLVSLAKDATAAARLAAPRRAEAS